MSSFWKIRLIETNMGLMFFFFLSALYSSLHPVGLHMHHNCTYSSIADNVGQVTVHECGHPSMYVSMCVFEQMCKSL